MKKKKKEKKKDTFTVDDHDFTCYQRAFQRQRRLVGSKNSGSV